MAGVTKGKLSEFLKLGVAFHGRWIENFNALYWLLVDVYIEIELVRENFQFLWYVAVSDAVVFYV